MNKAFRHALRDIFGDGALIIFMIVVPLIYPVIYALIYNNEVAREVPVAVVDNDGSAASREFLRRIDATPDVHIAMKAPSLEAAKQAVARREVYGVIHIPENFTRAVARMEQTHVSVFCDMSGMLYYKAILTAATDVSLDMNARIKIVRSGNTTDRQDEVTAHPLRYENLAIFNPQNGFASFLLPAVLMLIIQQTLILGVGMEAGTRRERMEQTHRFPPTDDFTLDAEQEIAASEERHRLSRTERLKQWFHPRRSRLRHASRRAWRNLLGRTAAFFAIYIPVAAFEMAVMPHLFSFPQVGRAADLLLFAVPYLLACIFFAISLSAIPRSRESIILIAVFTSVPMLFLSGVSWPGSAIPWYWKTLSSLIPSTFGINGFVRINTLGATLADVRPEYIGLWIHTLFYGLLAWWVTRKNEVRKIQLRHYTPLPDIANTPVSESPKA